MTSLGEADGKFPTAGDDRTAAPSPTPENPGGVYPKTSPEAEKEPANPAGIQGQSATSARHVQPSEEQGLTNQDGPSFKE